MANKKKNKKRTADKWNDIDRQGFADGNRTRAQTFADRKKVKNKRECRDFRWQG